MREEDLRLLLNFMYQGEVQVGSSYSQFSKKNMILIENSQVDQERIGSFLRTAETLQIKGLADHPLKEQCQKTSSVSHQNPFFKK